MKCLLCEEFARTIRTSPGKARQPAAVVRPARHALAATAPADEFRADALGRTNLFIGYSMSDPNIRLLLHSIWQTWEKSGHF